MCVFEQGSFWRGVVWSKWRMTGQEETGGESTSCTQWQNQSLSQTTHTHTYCMRTHKQAHTHSFHSQNLNIDEIVLAKMRKTWITWFDLVFINKSCYKLVNNKKSLQLFPSTVLHHLWNTVGDSMSSFLSADQSQRKKLKETDDLKLNVEKLSEVERNEKQMRESLSLSLSPSIFPHSCSPTTNSILFSSQRVLFNSHLDRNLMSGYVLQTSELKLKENNDKQIWYDYMRITYSSPWLNIISTTFSLCCKKRKHRSQKKMELGISYTLNSRKTLLNEQKVLQLSLLSTEQLNITSWLL